MVKKDNQRGLDSHEQVAHKAGVQSLDSNIIVYDLHTALNKQLYGTQGSSIIGHHDREDGGNWIHVDVSYSARMGFSIKARIFHPHPGMSQVVQQFVSHVKETERMNPSLCSWMNGLSLVYHRATEQSAGLSLLPPEPLFALQWPSIPEGEQYDTIRHAIKSWSDQFVMLLSLGSKPIHPTHLN